MNLQISCLHSAALQSAICKGSHSSIFPPFAPCSQMAKGGLSADCRLQIQIAASTRQLSCRLGLQPPFLRSAAICICNLGSADQLQPCSSPLSGVLQSVFAICNLQTALATQIANGAVCRLQIANTACRGAVLAGFARKIVKMSLRPRATPKGRARLQIPDCKYRLQLPPESSAAGLVAVCRFKTPNAAQQPPLD